MIKLALRLCLLSASLFAGISIASAEFDGNPDAPQELSAHSEFANFDVQISQSHAKDWYTNIPIVAQHGANCDAPPATHEVTTYEGSVFLCKNHLMTALNAEDSYGEIVLTPSQLLDWSSGPAVFKFDMSTEQMSQRDWPDIMLSPFMDNVATYYEIGADVWPKMGYQIKAEGRWNLYPIKDYERQDGDTEFFPKLNEGIAAGTNQSAVRQTFQLTVSKTNIKMERLASATAPQLTFFDEKVKETPFTQAVVQISQHSYNPRKDNSGVPATWHWDEFSLSPSIPFTLIKADKRSIPSTDGGKDDTVTFNAAAPANSYLRFSAVGVVELSFDNGATWVKAHSQTKAGAAPEHEWDSYFTSMPAGAKSVKMRFKANDWYQGPFIARDFSIWSLSQ